jgi:outer membrane protein OmpA-like peptidoglycan-associated protein
MKARTSLATATSTLALCAGVVACASAPPSQQLVDARHTYEQARYSRGAELVPDRFYEARQALLRAERAHQDDPGSEAERHQAYLAERQVRLAVAYADMAYAGEQAQMAEAQQSTLQDQLRMQARKDLRETRSQLAATRRALMQTQNQLSAQTRAMPKLAEHYDELEARKAKLEAREDELEKQLAVQHVAFNEERLARLRAEEDAKAALESLKEVATVRAEERQTIISLTGSVLFRTRESALLPTASMALEQVAEALKEQEEDKLIIVEGHTDSRGTEQYNERLSQERANSVRSFLIGQGLEPTRIRAVGRGESAPTADNDTPEGQANNRRVEIIIRDAERGTSVPSPATTPSPTPGPE